MPRRPRFWPDCQDLNPGLSTAVEVEKLIETIEGAIFLNDEMCGPNLSRETLSVLCRKVSLLREAARVMRHIDHLYTSDTDEQDFRDAMLQLGSND